MHKSESIMESCSQQTQVESDNAAAAFEQRFKMPAGWIAEAPGRVNLIGEHTDYNLLPVLPMTIDRKIRILFRRRQDSLVRIANKNDGFPAVEIDLAQEIQPVPGHWTNYVLAAFKAVQQEVVNSGTGPLAGLDMLVHSDLPVAAGLSSSSALVIASCLAILQGNDISWSSQELAEKMAKAERFVGTAGGGMDQTVIAMAENNSALLIEFAPLRPEKVAVPEGLAIYIINSGQKAEKTGAARFSYNRRSLECCLSVALLAEGAREEFDTSEWGTLRDVYDACQRAGLAWSDLLLRHLPQDPPDFEWLVSRLGRQKIFEFCVERQLDPTVISEWLPDGAFQLYPRAAHVMAEADRVYAFRDALISEDLTAIGHLGNASHASCRDLYHISTPKLEELAVIGQQCGASAMRITGAGFGGCLVGFVPAEDASSFEKRMLEAGVPADHLIRALPGGKATVNDFRRD